jgi:type I restriction enzyme S subunit
MRDGWVETNLEGIAEYINGYPFKPADLGETGVPVIRIKQLLDPNEPVDRTETETPERYLLKDGDIVFSWSGTLAVRIWNRGPAKLNQHLFRVLEKKGVYKGIIPLILDHAIEELEEKSHGTTMKHITKQTLLPHKVLLPPLPEQKRIVDLISSVDSYIEALQQQLESGKKSRNAVLHELLNAGGDDWEATTIGDISDFISVRKSPEQLSSDSIYVGLEHLEPNNTSIDKFDSIRKVTSSLTPFDVGDVLFGRLRPYLHKVAIAEMFGFCSPEILVLRANAKVLPQMLLLYCDADSTIKICVERSAGTRMPRTSTEDLASIEIKLPLMAEQIKLAELFNTFDTDISQIVNTLEKSKILRSGLLSDLLSGQHEIPASYDKVIGAA